MLVDWRRRSALNRVKLMIMTVFGTDSVAPYKKKELTFEEESLCGSPTCAGTVTVPGETRGVTTTHRHCDLSDRIATRYRRGCLDNPGRDWLHPATHDSRSQTQTQLPPSSGFHTRARACLRMRIQRLSVWGWQYLGKSL